MTLNVHRTLSALAVAAALVVSSGGIVAAAAALDAKPLRAEFAPTQQIHAKPLRAE
uniref:hypothetical protein n=1 Tax=Paractinoplanes polyasparticus TaxID=2856853 RepID=UPI001C866AB3|nr:hypothetical protein [Actinoplanes polyasparticus]